MIHGILQKFPIYVSKDIFTRIRFTRKCNAVNALLGEYYLRII